MTQNDMYSEAMLAIGAEAKGREQGETDSLGINCLRQWQFLGHGTDSSSLLGVICGGGIRWAGFNDEPEKVLFNLGSSRESRHAFSCLR